MRVTLDPNSVDSYRQFLAIKELPAYSIRGRVAEFPDEYASRIGVKAGRARASKFTPESFMFDYQRAITSLAIQRQRFAVFADCGLGKTLILLSYAAHVQSRLGKKRRVLIVSPPMVIYQTIAEAEKFWPGYKIERVKVANLAAWLEGTGDCIGITNYEALKNDTPRGKLGALILDESSILKSHYGNYAGICLRLGAGLEWKLCLTGTPAPNDRIEYANHAVFLDRFPTVNSFLATYFVNRGQTDERWELKPHALRPFYRSLSDWCIFLSDPATYGWKDNCGTLPPIHTHIENVPMTAEQDDWVRKHLGTLLAVRTGGITHRAAYGQVAKGNWKGQDFPTLKYEYIRASIESWPDESTLVWCLYDDEQAKVCAALPLAKSIDGSTPMWKRRLYIDWFCRRICDCELKRRIECERPKKNASTCESTTPPTSNDGASEPENSKTNSMNESESSTQSMKYCAQRPGRTPGSGKSATPTCDGLSDLEPTGSRQRSTTQSMQVNTARALSADTKAETGEQVDSTLITATKPEPSAGCSARTAISQSESSATTPSDLTVPRHICDCTHEQLSRGRTLVSKPRVLGFGLNLQVATRQVFSGLQDSYEAFYQCVKRSNRIGSTRPLNVHIPATDIEMPMIENVLRKAHRVEHDTREQEQLFKEMSA